tara:strand:- start:97 stop:276 length:180 start_codon:yes stop_codon:yes gene_type:complete
MEFSSYFFGFAPDLLPFFDFAVSLRLIFFSLGFEKSIWSIVETSLWVFFLNDGTVLRDL